MGVVPAVDAKLIFPVSAENQYELHSLGCCTLVGIARIATTRNTLPMNTCRMIEYDIFCSLGTEFLSHMSLVMGEFGRFR
jgi:hypothetical protein